MAEVLGLKGEEEKESTVVHGMKEEEENESTGSLGLKRKEEKEIATYSTAPLPLGFVFHPTDEQLISHYLRLKNEGRHSKVQIIAEVDFFNYDPWELPALSVIKSDNPQWYFFCLEPKYLSDMQIKFAGGGFWKGDSLARSIKSSEGLIGEKRRYVFFKQDPPGRSDWVTHCYRALETGSTCQNAFILCVLSNRISSLKYKDAASTLALSYGIEKRVKSASTVTSAAHPHEATAAASTVTDVPFTPIPLDGLPVDKRGKVSSTTAPSASFAPIPSDGFSIDKMLKALHKFTASISTVTDDPFNVSEVVGESISTVTDESSALFRSKGQAAKSGRRKFTDVPLALIPSDELPNDNISEGQAAESGGCNWTELSLKALENNINTKSQARLFGVGISCLELSSAVVSVGSSGGKKNEVDEIGAEPRTSNVGRKPFDLNLPVEFLQHQEPQSFRMWAGLGLAEPPQDEPWDNATEIQLMDNELFVLPKNPRCPVLSTLFLQRNSKLRTIPPSFFDFMPALQILNLSRTGIKSLPESIIKLVNLKRLFLNDCHCFMVLSPRVGELKRLEVLDLEGTDIKSLPEEIKKLTNLTCLEVSLYGYGRRTVQSYPVVPHGIISALSHLEELSIRVNPDDERWNSCVEAIFNEVCTLGHLNSLKFYFPRVELLGEVLLSSALWKFPSLSDFRFTVGHHVERIMSRRPSDVEFELERWERCLKYINGVAIPVNIKKVLRYSTAFFLERHATVKKLSDFGIGNMEHLKCCVVGECNEVEFIIDEADSQEEDSEADSQEEDSEANVHEEGDEVDAYEEDDEIVACEEDDDLDAHEDGDELDACEEDDNNEIESKKVVLGSLDYLFIYYMKNLRKIWEGPVQPRSLSLLKSLTLRTCPQLTTIFSEALINNLYNLEELTVEDCPSVTTLVSNEILSDKKASYSLPNLKRILLHYLPGLVGFSTGLLTAPKIEWMSFYNCPSLKSLLIEEVCSKNLRRIEGERSWWEALEWRSGRPAYLDDIFVPTN